MKTIALDKIIEKKKLDKKDLAQRLFPGNKYASLSLNRVIKGDGFLDSNQISLLSELTNIPINELYENNDWSSESTNGVIVFTSKDYRAELNIKSNLTKVFKNGSLFHESIIHSGSVPLSEYLDKLAEVISEHTKE